VAEQKDEWAEARRHMGPETVTACKKTVTLNEIDDSYMTRDTIDS
jgi:hypothetical protein